MCPHDFNKKKIFIITKNKLTEHKINLTKTQPN